MVAMKKILTSLLLIFIVSALLFSTVKIQPAKATTERMVNGGFEAGDFTGWTNGTGAYVVETVAKHSGLYACLLEQYATEAWANQTLSTFAVDDIASFDFWAYNIAGDNQVKVTVDYLGSATEVMWFTASSAAYSQHNILENLTLGEYVTSLRIEVVGTDALTWIDDVSLITNGVPTEYLCRFRSEPSGSYVNFSAGGSWHWVPQDLNLTAGSQTFTISPDSLIVYVNSWWIFGFDHWSITNTTGTFNSTGSSVTYNLQEDTNITMAYKTINIQVTASPALPAYFSSEYYGSNYSAPQVLHWNSGSHTFTVLTHTYSPNSSYVYTFDHWLVNGTDEYGSLGITLSFTADTSLTIVYVGSTVTPPYPYTYVSGALNATWYFRSDTWTVHSILGYKLQTVNTATPAFDERIDAATKNVSYGVRVWALDLFGNQYELTSGTPAAVATKTTEGSEMVVGYWTCPAYSSMIDSIKVNLYQQFNDEGWSLRRIYVTGSDLLIRLPSASWTFHYYVNRTVGSTYSTFGFGSYTTYNSRIDLQYYKANPWDLALARLWQRNFVGFLFAPWTYWFGDLFWSIILFGCIIMAWMRTGSFKPVLALLWIIGGSGSILWALIPASALHVAVLMLALAMAITLFRLIYGRRT